MRAICKAVNLFKRAKYARHNSRERGRMRERDVGSRVLIYDIATYISMVECTDLRIERIRDQRPRMDENTKIRLRGEWKQKRKLV